MQNKGRFVLLGGSSNLQCVCTPPPPRAQETTNGLKYFILEMVHNNTYKAVCVFLLDHYVFC